MRRRRFVAFHAVSSIILQTVALMLVAKTAASMDKIQAEGGGGGREVGSAGVGWRDGEKMQTTVIE